MITLEEHYQGHQWGREKSKVVSMAQILFLLASKTLQKHNQLCCVCSRVHWDQDCAIKRKSAIRWPEKCVVKEPRKKNSFSPWGTAALVNWIFLSTDPLAFQSRQINLDFSERMTIWCPKQYPETWSVNLLSAYGCKRLYWKRYFRHKAIEHNTKIMPTHPKIQDLGTSSCILPQIKGVLTTFFVPWLQLNTIHTLPLQVSQRY